MTNSSRFQGLLVAVPAVVPSEVRVTLWEWRFLLKPVAVCAVVCYACWFLLLQRGLVQFLLCLSDPTRGPSVLQSYRFA